MNKGKLIVIEGSDGSGKTTQLELLKTFLESQNIPVKKIDFPRYYDSFYGKVIARFLQGEFGKLEEINPYLISIVYALDRAEAKDKINTWLSEGNIVLSNRYAPSNLAHQSGRLPSSERQAYIDWGVELEYKVNKIPKEDVVVFLHVPYKVSLKLMKNTDRGKRDYLKGKKQDMVEKDPSYLKNAEEVYLSLAKQFPHWIVIECVDAQGNLRSREEIHEEVKRELVKRNLIS